MANVVEIAKASVTAYNDKNWSKAKDMLAQDAVYDEKGSRIPIRVQLTSVCKIEPLARNAAREVRGSARPALLTRA